MPKKTSDEYERQWEALNYILKIAMRKSRFKTVRQFYDAYEISFNFHDISYKRLLCMSQTDMFYDEFKKLGMETRVSNEKMREIVARNFKVRRERVVKLVMAVADIAKINGPGLRKWVEASRNVEVDGKSFASEKISSKSINDLIGPKYLKKYPEGKKLREKLIEKGIMGDGKRKPEPKKISGFHNTIRFILASYSGKKDLSSLFMAMGKKFKLAGTDENGIQMLLFFESNKTGHTLRRTFSDYGFKIDEEKALYIFRYETEKALRCKAWEKRPKNGKNLGFLYHLILSRRPKIKDEIGGERCTYDYFEGIAKSNRKISKMLEDAGVLMGGTISKLDILKLEKGKIKTMEKMAGRKRAGKKRTKLRL